MSSVKLSHPTKKINARIHLPGSKSESNRVLILNALSGNKISVQNLSPARDTQNLLKILASGEETINVLDAGTSMRFLTACYCATGEHKIITGSEQMNKRPIGPLVSALSELGFDVRYKGEEGFPPVEVFPIDLNKLEEETFIKGNVSSQFITALLLIAPFLPKGLRINFTTPLISRPYIEMTLKILGDFNISHNWEEDAVEILPGTFSGGHYSITPDWSSAAYWYSIAFLADEADIFLEGLRDDYTQGDRVIADWMKRFGITTEFTNEGARVQKTLVDYPKMMKMNFRDNPDLAQTFAAMFAGSNTYCTFTGIESLKIKETDRILALRQELRKMNILFDYSEMYEFHQLKGHYHIPEKPISTYNDHRMAMSFAPLALKGPIEIEHPEVVEKSYPGFWEDLKLAGFQIS